MYAWHGMAGMGCAKLATLLFLSQEAHDETTLLPGRQLFHGQVYSKSNPKDNTGDTYVFTI